MRKVSTIYSALPVSRQIVQVSIGKANHQVNIEVLDEALLRGSLAKQNRHPRKALLGQPSACGYCD